MQLLNETHYINDSKGVPSQTQQLHGLYIFIVYLVLLSVSSLNSISGRFLSNSQVHKINTRQTFDLYVPTANLTIYQKGVYYSGIKIYSHLPTTIKDLSDDQNKFKLALKDTSYIIPFTVWRNNFNM